MAITMTPQQIIDKVREAEYGRDVREALAQACEYVKTVHETALLNSDIATVAETKSYLEITH